MNLDDHLAKVQLIDCRGRTTHRLTLLINRRVEIRVGEVRAVVDPRTRAVEPPSRRLGSGEYGHDQVLDIACNLARGG